MRINQALFIAVFCLFLGGMLTPIISSSAKSGKGSSCKNPYRTTGANGEMWGDKVVRTSIKFKTLQPFVSEVTLKVIPKRNILICKVYTIGPTGKRTRIPFPSRGGKKVWVRDGRKGPVKTIDRVMVESRSK